MKKIKTSPLPEKIFDRTGQDECLMAAAIRVLYVDDEPDLLGIGKLFIEESGDFTVTTALSAADAIRLLEQEKFDTIISDYQMPGMDGIQFLVEVRKRFGPIPFILFTGRGREEVVIQAINSGADFYLQKGGEPGAQFAELTHKIKSAASSKRADDALRKSEEKYRHLIEHSDEAIVVAQDGVPKLVNHQTIEFTGYSEQELLSVPISTFIHPDDRAMVMEHYQKRMIGEVSPSRYPIRLIPRDGSTRWVEISVTMIDWEGYPATLNFLTDITERKQAEDAIRTAEETYRNIFLNSQIGLFRTDVRTGLLLDVNDTVARFIGYPDRASLLAKPFNIVERYADAYDHEKIISLLKADGEFRNYEARFVKNDGSIIWMRFSGKLVKEKGWIEGVSEDITERKRAEEALGESESFNRNLVENLPDYIGVSAPDGKILYMNASATNALGYTMEEIIGTSVLSYVAEECRGDVISKMAARPGGGEVLPYEIDVLSKDGCRISVIVKGTQIRYRNSPALLLVLTDITERKTAEKTLNASEEKYRSLVSNIPGIVYRCVNDPDWTMLYISQEIDPISDYPASDFINNAVRSYVSIIHPDDRDLVDRAVQKGVKKKSTYAMEYRICRADGSIRWVHELGKGVFAPNGDLLWLDGVILDQTERKVAEDALRVSEESYRAIYDQSPIAIELYDATGKLVHVNPACLKLFGIESMQVIQNFSLFADPNVNDEQKERLHKGETVQYSGPFDFEKVKTLNLYTTSREGIIWLDVLITPLGNRADSITGFLVQIQNITGRKRAEEALAESEQRFTLAINGTGAGLWDWDMVNDRVVYSAQWKRMLGYKDHEVENSFSGWKNLWHPDDITNIDKTVDDYLSGKTDRYENIHRLRHKDGSWRWIVTRGGIIKDATGKPLRWVGTNIDITERKLAEEETRRLTGFQESVIANARVWLSVLDPSGKILLWNTAAEEISGYPSEEVIGQKEIWKKIYPEKEYRKQITDTITRIIRDKNYLENFETTILSKQGTKKVISWNTRGIYNATGNVSDYIAIGVDITNRIRAEEALKDSTRRLSEIISFLPDAIFAIDKNGTVISWNRAIEDMTGVPAAQILGKGNYEYAIPFYGTRRPILIDLIFSPKDEVLEKYSFVEINGDVLTAETVNASPQGKNVSLWGKAAPLYDREGNVTGAIESIRDITERKVAEAAITESFAIFKTVMDSLDALVYVSDMKTHEILFINQYGKEIFGDITGKICWKSIQVDQKGPCPFCTNEKLLDLDDNPAGILIWEFKNTINEHWYECHDSAIRWTDGRIVRIEIASDITERKLAEEALKEHDEKIHLLLDSTAEAIYGLDLNGNCTFCNNSCLRLLGYNSPDELLGKNMHWQIHHKHPDGTHFPVEDCRIFRAFNKGEGTHVDDEVLWRSDGTSFPAEYWSYPQRHEGNVVGAVVTFIDITERKELEKEMEYHALELRQFSTSLAAANKKLNLLSSITRHDINNQLTVLMGFLTILKKKQPDPTLNEYFVKVSNAAQRISAMIQFTREYEAIGVSTPVWQDVRTVLDTAAKQAPLGKIIVKNDLPAGQEVFADPLVVKVFYNLMDNAVRYGGKITMIRFSAEEHGGDQIIVCEDDGDGVVTEEKEKIFERGFGKNTGLGLALSREILSITGITIRETGEPGKGARFEMTVPKGAWRITGKNDGNQIIQGSK